MKRWSRLTAFVLACAIVLSNVSGALALVEVNVDTLTEWIQNVKEANGLGDVIWLDRGGVAVPPSTFVPTTEGPQYSSETTVNLSSFANEEDIQMLDVYLGEYAKVNLVAPEAGQWLAYLVDADIWVPITNEMDSTFVLTYAKVVSLLDQNNGQALLCCAMANGATEVVNVQIQPEMATLELTDKDYTETNIPALANESRMAYAAAPAAEGDQDKYTVVIQYIFQNGNQAASPWTATVEAGGDIIYTVESPYVMGYLPEAGKETVEVEELSLSEDKTYTVIYHPTEVEYTVVHMQQNADNDNYTEVARAPKTGFTESPVGKGHEKSYSGFYALLYDENLEIAADGSTEVTVYYDRYYYLMNFELGGGYGVEPIYARYGADLGTIGTPTKAGYTFAGWQLNGADVTTLPTTMPAENRTYVAKWTAQTTTFDVVFWYENANDNKYSQAGVLENQTAMAGDKVNGSSYANTNFTGRDTEHFTYSHADSNVVVKGDGSTVVNVYYSRNAYTITFVMSDSANGCSVPIHNHADACYQLICGQEEHNHATSGCTVGNTTCIHATHELSCYEDTSSTYTLRETTPSQTLTPNADGIYTYTTGSSSHYYLYLNGVWYCYYRNSSTKNDTREIELDCSHTHTDQCYSCGKINHTHVTGCQDFICGKYEHYHSGSTCYLVVTKKYDADITDVWEKDPVKAVRDSGKLFESSRTDDWYSFLEKMPGYDLTMTAGTLGSVQRVIYYYTEQHPDKDYSGVTTKEATKNNVTKKYFLYKTVPLNVSSSTSLTYTEDYFPITGYTQRDTSNNWTSGFTNGEAFLYYVRNSYELAFSNGGSIVTGKGGTKLYETDISGEYFVPDYPQGLEPGAYVFEGWYESPFFGDTKFEFVTKDENGNIINATMPAKDLTLYARWVPVEHNVNIYLTKEDGVLGNKVGETQVVDHRELAKNPYPNEEQKPIHPASVNYEFVGWFYMDGDTEKGFDFSMPITQDLDLYAKWSSNKIMSYTVHYQLRDGTPVAESYTSSGLAGEDKTFYAKYGDELYDKYQTGYFPHTNSHSLTIDIEDESKNVFIFYYDPMATVAYTVQYLEYGTGNQLVEPKVVSDNTAMIVTETFVAVDGYMPDAYQKRLVLSSNATENVITFWYTQDEVHAPVNVIHYTQNIEGSGYTEYLNITDLNGLINQQYTTDVIHISGYTFDHATANDTAVTPVDGKVTYTVTDQGLLIELYYNRNDYPYEFRFLEQGTEKQLADPVAGTARYGAQVTQNKKEIPGYTCSTDSKAITIRIEDGNTAEKNVAIFYYTEQTATINYEVVGPAGCGSLTRYSEPVKAVTDDALGATATPTSNAYKFVGWYLDAECTKPVNLDSENLDGTLSGDSDPKNTFVPTKAENEVWVDGTTYYAKFEYNLTYLTIEKYGAASDDTFVFSIDGENANGMQVVIQGNTPVTVYGLTVDEEYTVTEIAHNFRYGTYTVEPANGKITLDADRTKNVVKFANKVTNNQWLDDDDYEPNAFTGVANQ